MINYNAFFKISYGLYIVSSGNESVKNGFISNSVFQVTAEPPQFAACCNKDNHTAEIIAATGNYTISVLHEETKKELIGQFGYKSGRDIDKFQEIEFSTGETGAPVVTEETIAIIECKVVQTFDVGSHLIFIGEVVSSEVLNEKGAPMTYSTYREKYKGVAPKNAPTYIDRKNLSGQKKPSTLPKYRCPACGYIYDPAKGDPDSGIEPGTAFDDLPDDWICPLCGTEKADFILMDE